MIANLTETNGLEDCPFCGSNDVLVPAFVEQIEGAAEPGETETYYAGQCQSCGARGPAMNTEALAGAAWNDRHGLENERLGAAVSIVFQAFKGA